MCLFYITLQTGSIIISWALYFWHFFRVCLRMCSKIKKYLNFWQLLYENSHVEYEVFVNETFLCRVYLTLKDISYLALYLTLFEKLKFFVPFIPWLLYFTQFQLFNWHFIYVTFLGLSQVCVPRLKYISTFDNYCMKLHMLNMKFLKS